MGAREDDFDEWGIGWTFKKKEWYMPRQSPSAHELLYDTSWDWLMPVVDHIDELDDGYGHYLRGGNDWARLEVSFVDCHQFDIYEVFNTVYNLFSPELRNVAPSKLKLQCTFWCVVEFISWYTKKSK